MIQRTFLIATVTLICFLASDVEACRWRLRRCRCVCVCQSTNSNKGGAGSGDLKLDPLPAPLPELKPLPEDFTQQARNRLFAVRTWTHHDGRSLEGRCVAVSRDSVRLAVDGSLYEVSLSSFCETDRAELSKAAEIVGERDMLYVGLSAAPVEREWTDALGQTVQATLIGADDREVLLETGGDVFTLPLTRFSAEDQSIVRDLRTGQLLAARDR
ncbi:MAG: hypothetical protein RIC55_08985 [Pirellulaceae bacterium]